MRGQLNIRVDEARKQRWHRVALAAGFPDFTAWMTTTLDREALEVERTHASLFPDEDVAPGPPGYPFEPIAA